MSWLSTARLPQPYNPERLAVAWTRWRETAAMPDDRCRRGTARRAVRQQPVSDRDGATEPEFHGRSVARRSRCRAGASSITSSTPCAPTRARGAAPEAVAARLRRLKRSVALTVAVADIAGAWPLERITGTLSRFAVGLHRRAHRGDPAAARTRGTSGARRRSPGRRLHRARHGQARRRRAQLLERHRPDPAVRPRGAGARGQRATLAPFRARLAHAGAADVGGVGRRLHLPHRPAAAARSRLDAARHVGPGGRALLRERRPELGTRGDDQGASRGRQSRRRRGVPGGAASLHLARAISTSRRSTTSIRSSARSTPIAAAARSRSPATTSSWAAAASARSSSSPRPSS